MAGNQNQMELDNQQQMAEQQPKKMKMTFDEYRKYAFMIVHIMKEYERRGEDNVRQ